MIASISYVKKALGELKAKKKYGQNFLIDANIVDKIAAIACDPNHKTIEIGPGLGGLTEMLLKYSKEVDAYEIDPDMFELLTENLRDERLHVYLQDFLDTELNEQEEVNICGNLPYYVTTPILFKIFESDLQIRKITVMVQKEVAQRISADVNTEDYSALSIEIQYLYDVRQEINVSRKVFYPQPNVDSMVISFIPKKINRDMEFERRFFVFVKNCFRMRRKTLYNNLKDLYDKDVLEDLYQQLNLCSSIRAQEISLSDFLKIFSMIDKERGTGC